MVDVGAKPETERTAVARGEVHLRKETIDLMRRV
jgi:molybdenum cofactor biosynthesis enzyme